MVSRGFDEIQLSNEEKIPDPELIKKVCSHTHPFWPMATFSPDGRQGVFSCCVTTDMALNGP